MRSLLGLLSLLAVGCARLPQVPASQPHGKLLVRVVHPVSNRMYQDFVTLDSHDELELGGLGDKEAPVRVAPGRHRVVLSTGLASFSLQDRTVDRHHLQCTGLNCAQSVPVREWNTTLVHSGAAPICSEEMHVQIKPGDERLLLLVAGPDCQHCVTADLNARSCTGVRSLEEPGHACQSLPPELTRYDEIEDAREFSLTLRQDEQGEWTPAHALAMPYHQASHIDLQSVSLLARHGGQRVTVRAVGVGKPTVVARTDSQTLRASYTARIEQVCPASAKP